MKAWNKFCCALASLVLLMGSLAAPAFAYGTETAPAPTPDPAPAPVTVPTAEPAEEAPVTVQEEVTGPLTPEGNLTLVDDYHTTYSDGSGQQFITMVSKSGAYFYLVIDRASDGDQTVHFLNMVDEADLLALMEEEQADAYNAEKEAAIQAELEKQQAEEEAKKAAEEAEAEAEAEEKDFDITGIASKFLGVIALVGLAAGGGFYFFLQKKKKEQAAKESVDPDADYREDEEEIVLPDGEPEPDAAQDEEADRKAYQTSDGYEDV